MKNTDYNFKNTIIRKGERLRLLREEIGMKVTDFNYRENDITINKGVISKIENNKDNQVDKKLPIIAKIMDKYIDDKSIKHEHVNLEYLMRAENEVIKDVIEVFKSDIETLKNCERTYKNVLKIDEKASEIDEFVKEYVIDFESKMDLLHELGRLFSQKCFWEKSFFYIQRCRDIALIIANQKSGDEDDKNKKDTDENKNYEYFLELLNSEMLLYVRLDKFENAIKTCDYALEIHQRYNTCKKSKYIYSVRYNKAYSLKKIGKLDESMEELENLKLDFKETITDSQLFEIDNLISQIYFSKKDLKKTKKILLKLKDVQIKDDIDLMSMLQINYARLYAESAYKAKEYELEDDELKTYTHETRKYLETLSELKFGKNSYVVPIHLCETIDVAIKIDEINIVNKMYKNAVEKAIDSNNCKILYEIIEKIFNYHIKKKREEHLEEFLKTLKMINNKILNLKLSDYFIMASDYFKKDKIKSKKYLREAIEIIKHANKI